MSQTMSRPLPSNTFAGHYLSTANEASRLPSYEPEMGSLADAPGWQYRHLPAGRPSTSPSPALPKMRSFPSRGARGPIPSSRGQMHGKLHKRAESASSTTPAATAAGHRAAAFAYNSPTTPPLTESEGSSYAFPGLATATAPNASSSRTRTKIKPLLRKLAGPEEHSLDLSRSMNDPDGLSRYGSELGPSQWALGDTSMTAESDRGGLSHHRSTSATSQFSSNTSLSGVRGYVHPMRQTPRPYTPPIAHSYQNSILGSEYSGEAAPPVADDDGRGRSIPSKSLSNQGLPLRVQTDLSSTTKLLEPSASQLPASPISAHPRLEARSPADQMSPLGRSSMEKRIPKRTRTLSDDPSREASIRAARQAFLERESAKAQKAEKEELRALEREQRKRERLEESQRRKSDARERGRSKASSLSEKTDIVAGREYSTMAPAPDDAAPQIGTGRAGAGAPRRRNAGRAPRTTVRARWVGFMVWLKTRLFKLGRRIGGRW